MGTLPSEVKIVISDVHLGPGDLPGLPNPFEDFRQDDRLAEMIRHYSEGPYGELPVGLIINGDFLDLLKVPWQGGFPEIVTEEIALDKARRCIRGHPLVFDAIASFLLKPGHTVTYVAGNHDVEIAFPRVQRLIQARLDIPEGDTRLVFVVDDEFLRLPRGVVVAHGHNFETMNRIEPGRSLTSLPDGRLVANLPFGSRFVMNVLLPHKAEQPLLDQVHPLSSFILWGLVFDLRFTLKILWHMATYLLATRFRRPTPAKEGLLKSLQIFMEEVAIFSNMERRAFRMLRESEDISALVCGHNHAAKVVRFPRNKVYVNTGTWRKIFSLELRDLGSRNFLTYALIEYHPTIPPGVRLMRWRGKPKEMEEVLA